MLPGREDELARIDRLLDGARSGVSAALIVHGDPGIGKTALLDAVASSATGFTVLRAEPLQTESELPFAGLSDLLRPLLPLLDRIPAPQAAVLSGVLALGPPTPGDRFAAAAATISLLAAGAEAGPVLAVVDDAHWLDTPSREAILFAGRRLGSEGLLLLMAMRDRPWLANAGITRVELTGLEHEAAAGLIRGAARQVSPEIRDRLIADTGGNPLAILEALATLTDDQLSGALAFAGPIATGRSVERSFAQRLEPLASETRAALVIAAASDTGDSDEITRALECAGLRLTTLDAARLQGLVIDQPGRVEFSHPLLRAATYHAADPVDQRAAHRTLARVLDPSQRDRIAWHLAAAAVEADEEVARLLEETASAAQGRRGYVAAANALATSARLSPAVHDRIRRTMGAANAFRLGGQPMTAADLLADIVEVTADPILRADIQQLRAASLMFVLPVMQTFALLVEEADRVESHDPQRAASMLAIASMGVTGAAAVELSMATAQRAVGLSGREAGPVRLLAALALASSLTLAGRVAEAREILKPLIPVLETTSPLGEAGYLVVTVAHMLTWMEEWDTARRIFERIVKTARDASAITLLPHPLAILCELELRCGHMAAAYAAGTEAVRLGIETGQAVDSAIALVCLARVEALLGLEDECRNHVAAALDVANRFGITAIEHYSAAVLGLLELSLGRASRATVHLAACARLEAEHGLGLPSVVQSRADLVEAYVRVGRTDDAVRELDTLEEQGLASDSRWAAATAARCRGMLADEEGYETVLLRALELHGAEEPFERARTELCLGRRRRHSRHRAAARVVLHSALSTFETLGSEPWAEQTRVELRATGEAPAPTPGASLMALTSQELQVALVVAGGATNKEAAAALFISPKTIEFHLGHVYGKLGVRSRSELVRKVAGLS